MTSALVRFVVWSLLLSSVKSLDLAIRSISCDDSLPVSVVDVVMTCNDYSRCTFGDYAVVQGLLRYSGVDSLALKNNVTAYISGEFDVSVDLLVIPDGTVLDLCNDDDTFWVAAVDSSTVCPEDGTYDFEATFTLPDYGDSWWATGWRDSGEISLYADENQEVMIGSCQVRYVTQVTSANRFLHAPSAFTTAMVAIGVGLVGVVWALYCVLYVRSPRRRTYKESLGEQTLGRSKYAHGAMYSDDNTMYTGETETVATQQSGATWQSLRVLGGFGKFVEKDQAFAPAIVPDMSYDSGIMSSRSQDTEQEPEGSVTSNSVRLSKNVVKQSKKGDEVTSPLSMDYHRFEL